MPLDTTPPVLSSITRVGATLTNASTVSYTVTFSEAVTGVDASAFSLAAAGSDTAASIAGVVAVNASTYTVTVNTGGAGHNGTIQLDLTGAKIKDLAGNGFSGGLIQAVTSYAVSAAPLAVSLADVNGDGNLDIVTANPSANTASVLLGNGNGAFAAQTTYAVGAAPNSVALADVNGDGNVDIVTTNRNGGNVSVLLGNGNGSFAAQTTYAVGVSPFSVALADVNGDGKLDIVTAN